MITKKLLLLGIAFLAVLVIGRGQVQAFTRQSLRADQPYWPSFGYDRQNTSHSPHPGPGPGPVEMAWFYPAARGRVINQQPTVDADGTVYFATWGWVDEEAEDYAHGLLYALNPDGALKWVYDPGPPDCPLEKTWCYGTIETSPAIGPDGTIYIGRGDGVLRAVSPDSTLKWSFETIPNTKGRGQILSSPAVSPDGIIYFGTIANLLSAGYGNNVFYAVKDMGDHAELLWTYPADAAEGGTLDDGVWSNPAIGPDGAVYFAAGRTIYAFWPDGAERWHKTTLYKMYTPVLGPDGTVYVQATGVTGLVYALNPDGTKKWTYAVGEGETIASNVSVGPDGTLYVGSGTREDDATPDPLDEPQNVGKLYALVDRGDHAETKWVVDFGSSAGAPAIDRDGFIYVGLRGDTSTLRQSSGQASLSAGLNADPPVRGRAVALRDTGDRGEILWSIEAGGELWLGKPAIGSDRTVYFADAVCMDYLTCNEDTDVPALYAVRPVAPPADQCVRDVNGNGVGDVVDIQAAAADLDCHVYLPLVAAQWRQPWPAPTALVITIGDVDPDAPIKPLLGVNAGPVPVEGTDNPDVIAGYQQIGVSAVRTHDYMGPLDMATMYPDQNADPSDPASYDFQRSDEIFAAILAGGFEPYLRVGDSSVTVPGYPEADPRAPTNPDNWVGAAVEVVRHYRELAQQAGASMRYVEIWNEPNLTRFWDGTRQEFFDLFAETASALKAEFPELQVGGPGLGSGGFMSPQGREWTQQFIEYLRAEDVPLDFFSWHLYSNDPADYVNAAQFYRDQLDSRGFTATESHINEYNTRVVGVDQPEEEALRLGGRGAALVTAAWIGLQERGVDRALFYRGTDWRLENPVYYGLFLADGRPKRSALAFSLWSEMSDHPERLSLDVTPAGGFGDVGVWTIAGQNAEGKIALLIANPTDTAISWRLAFADGRDPAEYTVTVKEVSDASGDVQTFIPDGAAVEMSAYSVQLVLLNTAVATATPTPTPTATPTATTTPQPRRRLLRPRQPRPLRRPPPLPRRR